MSEHAPEVVITPMRRRHLRGVLRIEHQVYPRPWSMGLFINELALPPEGRRYLVARVEGTVVGYAGLMVVLDDGHVTNVAVDPAWHRRSIATRLLLCLARDARSLGVRQMTLEVRMSNTGAQELYRRFGFVPAGARKAYYVDNREDALVMWCHDIDTSGYADRLAGIEAGLGAPLVRQGSDA